MEETLDFSSQLHKLIAQKTEWYNGTEFPRMLDLYRLLHACVKNIYEFLIEKRIINEDPYRFDKKISEIQAPDSSSFNEAEKTMIMGTRFSDYFTMLDFVCTYTRFSVETINLSKIKKLQELNACFNWDELTSNSTKPNTRTLALMISEGRTNAPALVQSMLNDSLAKCSSTISDINKMLNQLIRFQREIYKASVRKNLQEHPSFNKLKAYESSDAELAEIKKLFAETMGKKTPFYTELINEIIAEDTNPDKERIRAEVLNRLTIKDTNKKVVKKTVDTHAILMNAVMVLGALPPTYHALTEKITDNFDLIQSGPTSFFGKLAALFKKAFGIPQKDTVIKIVTVDPVTNHKVTKEVKVNELIEDITKKTRIYTGIGSRGPEFSKIDSAKEDQVIAFLGKQISENQNLYTTLFALDEYFKSNTPSQVRARVKGIKIDLDTMKNTIINCNKKRGEYQAVVEEAEQMKRLGINDGII